MAYGGHADRHEIVRSQVPQNLHINVVVAESLLVLSEPQAPQPARNVHVPGLRKRQTTIIGQTRRLYATNRHPWRIDYCPIDGGRNTVSLHRAPTVRGRI